MGGDTASSRFEVPLRIIIRVFIEVLETLKVDTRMEKVKIVSVANRKVLDKFDELDPRLSQNIAAGQAVLKMLCKSRLDYHLLIRRFAAKAF